MHNPVLADKMNVSEENRKKIDSYHVARANVCRNPEKWVDPVATLEKINTALQRLWGFPADRNFHQWWELKDCSCPWLDNRDRLGTPYRVISADCKWHSGCKECGAKLTERHKMSCDTQYKDK